MQHMKMTNNTLRSLFILLVILPACVPQTPIPVYVTPTPDPAFSVPTNTPSEQPITPSATATVTVTASATSTQGIQTAPTTPAPTFIGAVIGPNYTLQPTETPRPTETQPVPTQTPSNTPTPPGPTPTPLPTLDPSRIGVQLYTNLDVGQWEGAVGHATQLGVGWVKMQVNWAFLQPNGPQDFGQEFALFQLHVQKAKQSGFKVLLSVAKAPNWARSNQNEAGPPDDPQLLGNFITFLLDKVGSSIDAIEIWNEPNLIREWTGVLPFNGQGYMQLFGPAYGAVRGYSPNLMIVTAGLAPTQGPGTVDDRLYLQQMYDAGLRNYRDIAVGIHPYSWGNPPDVRCCDAVEGQSWDDDPRFFFLNNVEDYRNIMVSNGHSEIQMWATEFGWATWEGLEGSAPEGDDWMGYNDKWDQGNYTIQALEIAQGLSYMGPMFIWNLNFATEATVAQRLEIAAYSILIPNKLPIERPLYWMLGVATGKIPPPTQ